MNRKILIIVQNNPVPFDDRVWKEALSLHQADYQVSVLCPKGKGAERAYELIDGIHIYRHPIPNEGNSPLAYVWEYGCSLLCEIMYSWWIYLRRGFHVIQGCNPPDDIFLVALPFKLFGVRYIFDHHDVNPELYLSKYGRKDSLYKVQTWLERLTFRFSDVVMSTNHSYKDVALIRGGLAPEDIFVVRNGPELNTFKAVPPNPAVKYGKRYLIGYVGVMSVQEGLDILLDVAQHIKNLGRNDLHFTCVGSGSALAGLRKMTQERDLGDMVNFTGRVPFEQLLEVLSTADVCVNPDKPCDMNDMSTMIKIMEYMALGKPIVQFDVKEGRFSAQEASLYSRNQVADFADKILWLLDHPEERQRMGEFGRRRIQEELAWQYSVPNLLSAYERAFSKIREKHALHPTVRRSDYGAHGVPAYKAGDGLPIVNTPSLNRYFKCPNPLFDFAVEDQLSSKPGFFRLGPDAVCYGRVARGILSGEPSQELCDMSAYVRVNGNGSKLPFNPEEIIQNLREERYAADCPEYTQDYHLIRDVYYGVRPWLPLALRKYLQRIYLRGWETVPFPKWPVDRTADHVLEELLIFALRSKGLESIPFIWFWPDGANACAIMTHDVEAESGKRFCSQLMDLDDSFGIPASFQIVPEERYSVEAEFINEIWRRGFEVNIQDLNHDGKLFQEKVEFERRVQRINSYGKKYQAAGFRSAVLYRNQEWFNLLEFEYDMSVPSVAHLEPQRGGCCTIMPYFVGGLVELPVTTTQDYSLFNVLDDFTMNIWEQQASLIRKYHGLMNFIVHPDYILSKRAQDSYKSLMSLLRRMRNDNGVWLALPREVNRWWRQRDRMVLTRTREGWSIEGEGSERARIAFASLQSDRLVYSFGEKLKTTRALA